MPHKPLTQAHRHTETDEAWTTEGGPIYRERRPQRSTGEGGPIERDDQRGQTCGEKFCFRESPALVVVVCLIVCDCVLVLVCVWDISKRFALVLLCVRPIFGESVFLVFIFCCVCVCVCVSARVVFT